MEVRILGPIQVRSAGVTLPLGGPRQRAVLAMLALRVNELVPDASLIDGLWGESAPAGAAGALQVHVSRLRKSLLGSGRPDTGWGDVRRRTRGYLLELDPASIDWWRFQRLARAARSETTAPTRSVELLREALDLWRGEPLAEFADLPFTRLEFTRLEEARLDALNRRIELELNLGHHRELIGELESQVGRHPSHEGLHAQLMLSLYRSGRQAEALDAYQRARRYLAEEMGVDPGNGLSDLHAAILSRDAGLDLKPPTVAITTASTDRQCDPVPIRGQAEPGELVGRDEPLAALHAAAVDAHEDSLVAMVAGEAGIGKTVLIERFGRQRQAYGARVLVGGCVELAGDPIPHAPLAEMMRQLERAEWMDPEMGSRVRSDLFRLLYRDCESPTDGRGALFHRVLDLLQLIADSCEEIVLVFEDLHWADQATLDLVSFLARALPRRTLLVLTYRNDELPVRSGLRGLLALLGRHSGARRVDLGRLSRPELAELAEQVWNRTPTGPEMDTVLLRSEGNPFLAHELLCAGGGVNVHESVEETLLARTVQLSPTAAELTRQVAIFQRPVSHDLLTAHPHWVEEDRLLAALRENVDSGILTIDPQTHEYRFRHVLTQEALLRRVLPGERRRLHAAAGAALQEQSESPPAGPLPDRDADLRWCPSRAAECATHWFLSGQVDAAFPAAVKAGRLAAGVYAWAEASLQFTRALSLAERVSPAITHAAGVSHRELPMMAAEAAQWAGDDDHAITLTETALNLAVDPIERAGVLERLAQYLVDTGRLDQALTTVDQAQRLLADAPATTLSASVAVLRASLLGKAGSADTVPAGRAALDLACTVGAPLIEGRARLNLGVNLILAGEVEEGTRLARVGHQLISETGDLDARSRADNNLSYGLLMAGNAVEACEVATRGVAQFRRHRMDPVLVPATANAVLALRLTGRWKEADNLIKEALIDDVPTSAALGLYLDRVELDTVQGRFEEAHHFLDLAWHFAQANQSPATMMEVHLVTSELAFEEQDLRTAQHHARLADQFLTQAGAPLRWVAQVCCTALRIEAELAQTPSSYPTADGIATATLLLNRVEDAHTRFSTPETDALAATANAEYISYLGNPDPDLWRSAAQAWDKATRPYETAYCYYRCAEAAALNGATDSITKPLGRCRELATTLGATTILKRTDTL